MKNAASNSRIEAFMLTLDDFKGMFSILDKWAKSLLAWEICRGNINDYAANARWVAWATTKRLSIALVKSGLEPEDVIRWLEAVAEERKEKQEAEEVKIGEDNQLKQAA